MEDEYQYFISRGNIVQLPLSTDSSSQPCVYWSDIENCFPGMLRIQHVVYSEKGSVRAQSERQRQNSSSLESPMPSTFKKLLGLQKKYRVATSEMVSTSASLSTSASSPTATTAETVSKPMLSPLAAAIAAMSESSLVPATTAALPLPFSGFSPVVTSGPTVTSTPVVGFKTSSSLPATKASGVLLVKVTTVQRADPPTTPTTTPTTTTCLESSITGSAVTLFEEIPATETPIIPLADRAFKIPVSPTRRFKEYRFSNIEELAPEIQRPISMDAQEDEVNTTTILPLVTAADKDAMRPELYFVQEPISTSFNTPRSIGAFPERAHARSARENKETMFIPASTQEETSSPFSRLFGLFQ
ncbi:hypothetical protein BGZ92_007619 [Podila epicladia]|nr:hypothetical protein BGZ92_007619 [Podila epicladia]